MPRKDYLKYFARDKNNNYVGTETERIWTDEDLELKFGKYKGLGNTRWVMGREAGRIHMVEEDDDVQRKEVFQDEKFEGL
jgi:hypothetical protein